MCFSVDFWIAFWTFALVVATGAIAWVALVQIASAREENRKTQTLLACGNYDTNPVIFECHRKLIAARDAGEFPERANAHRLEIMTILNFLDAIAIGIDQGLYEDDLARAHLSGITQKHVRELIGSGCLERLDCARESYATLLEMNKRWGGNPPSPPAKPKEEIMPGGK